MATYDCLNLTCPIRGECDRLFEMDRPPCANAVESAPSAAPNTGSPKLPPCDAELSDTEVWDFAAKHKFRFCPYCGRQLRNVSLVILGGNRANFKKILEEKKNDSETVKTEVPLFLE
jgi:hypothetical protein